MLGQEIQPGVYAVKAEADEHLTYQAYIQQVYVNHPEIYLMHMTAYNGKDNWKQYTNEHLERWKDGLATLPDVGIGVVVVDVNPTGFIRTRGQRAVEKKEAEARTLLYRQMWSERKKMPEVAAWWAKNAQAIRLQRMAGPEIQIGLPDQATDKEMLTEIDSHMQGMGISPYGNNAELMTIAPEVARRVKELTGAVKRVQDHGQSDTERKEQEHKVIKLFKEIKSELLEQTYAQDQARRKEVSVELRRRWHQGLSPLRTQLAGELDFAEAEIEHLHERGYAATREGDDIAAEDRANHIFELQRTAQSIRTADRMAEYEENMHTARSWTGAAVAMARFVDPELAEELALLSDVGFSIAAAAGKLAISGGVDPTAMAQAFSAVGALLTHMEGRPSQQAIMLGRLQILMQGQKQIKEHLKHIDGRLVGIKNDIERLWEITAVHKAVENRQMSELRAELAGMERRLESKVARNGLSIERIANVQERREVESLVAGTASLHRNWRERKRWTELQRCRVAGMCTETALTEMDEARRLLGQLAHRLNGTPLTKPREVGNLSHGELEALLEAGLEERLPYIRSLIVWILTTAEGSFGPLTTWGDSGQVHALKMGEHKGIWTDPIRSGWIIKEYLDLARWLPQRTNNGRVIRDLHSAPMCEVAGRLREETRAVRALIPIAWRLYQQFSTNAARGVQRITSVDLRQHSDPGIRAAALRLQEIDLQDAAPLWRHYPPEQTEQRIGSDKLYMTSSYSEVEKYRAELSHEQQGRTGRPPVPNWSWPKPAEGRCVKNTIKLAKAGCDLTEWYLAVKYKPFHPTTDLACIWSGAETVNRVIDFFAGSGGNYSCVKWWRVRRAKNAIKGFHDGADCPAKHRVYKKKCTETHVTKPVLFRSDIVRMQEAMWTSLQNPDMWRTLTLARLAFDTLVRWSVGERLGTDKELAQLHQFLKGLPDGGRQGPMLQHDNAQPTWEKIRALEEEVENRTMVGDTGQQAAKIARWASTVELTALNDYIDPKALTACSSETEVRAQLLRNEWRARSALYTAAGKYDKLQAGNSVEKDVLNGLEPSTPPWDGVEHGVPSTQLVTQWLETPQGKRWLKQAVDALPLPSGRAAEPSVLDDGWHGLRGQQWKAIAKAHGWEEEPQRKPSCEDVRAQAGKWLTNRSDQLKTRRERAGTAHTISQRDATIEAQGDQPKQIWGRMYGLVRPPVPTGETWREGPGWGAQRQTFARLLALQTMPSMRLEGACLTQ